MSFAAPLRAASLLAMGLAAGGGGGVPVRLHVGVDLGAQYVKVALELAQGSCSTADDASGCRGLVPRSDPTVLTPSGLRKTASAVRFRDGAILYGSDALATRARHPALTFVHLRQMLGFGAGRSGGEGRARAGAGWFEDAGIAWYEWLEAEGRGTLRLTSCCPHLCVSAEELSAVLLAHLSDCVADTLADERAAGLPTADSASTVIAVPPWWGACERQALRDAAAMAGLGGRRAEAAQELELVDAHLALGFKFLHLWSGRQDQTAALTAMLIDAGATGVTAAVVTLSREVAGNGRLQEGLVVESVACTPHDRAGIMMRSVNSSAQR